MSQFLERSRVELPVLPITIKALFAVLFSLSFSPIIFGQSVDGRPVAKLITATPGFTRARRVNVVAGNGPASAFAASLSEANPIERRAFEQTNLARERNGLPKFEWDPDLHRMARLHSENMARLGFFSHVTPEGLRLRDRIRAIGIQQYNLIGENIAYNLGYDDPGGFAVERWLISPGHRANILSAGFRAMAVGTFVAADGSVFLTQVFITR
jgi:uncharacterized protein YkwD